MSKPDKSQGITALLLIVGLPLLIGGFFAWHEMDLQGARARASASMAAAEVVLADQGIAIDPPDASSPWTYATERDELSGRDATLACTQSSNTIRLDYPYRSQQLTLCIRRHPRWDEDVFFVLRQGGQFRCPIRNCLVRVRAGDGEIGRYSVNEPSDGSNDTIFIANEQRFIAALSGVTEIAMEAEYYQAGSQTATFSVANLRWPPGEEENSEALPTP